MEHAIESLQGFFHSYLGWLRAEWRGGRGEYKKLSECPYYGECKALVDAIHRLEKQEYGEPKMMPLSDWVR
jgi:hypothetical protein